MDNIPKGYKQTEVGVIPENWEVKKLRDCFSFSGGYTASRDQLSNDGYCYLHYGDIHGANKTFIDVKKEYSKIPKLNVTIRNISPKSLLNEGDVVFVDASEDDEGASKHIVVFNSEGIPFLSGLHTIVSKSKNDNIDNGYKRYCFQPSYVKSQFKFYAVGTKVTGISKTNIAKILIPLPTKAEQTAIATALSDADALISSLEKLIAKKRNIKQGAMQELLRPKEGWEMKKLREVATLKARIGWQGLTTAEYRKSGDYFLVTGTEFKNGFIDWENCFYVEEERYKQDKNIQIKKHDVLVTKDGTIGKVALIKSVPKPATLNSGVFVIRPINNSFNPEFFYYLLLSEVFLKFLSQLSPTFAIRTQKRLFFGHLSPGNH